MDIRMSISPPMSNHQLNELFARAWENHQSRDFQPVLSRSLLYICAFHEGELVGFVNVAWDGGVHGFILDTTVHVDYQGKAIGTRLIDEAIEASKAHNLEWMHVDYESHLCHFYENCGFQPTDAGLINLTITSPRSAQNPPV